MIKKLKKIYRILFPKKITQQKIFENILLENKCVSKVEKINNRYKVEINRRFSVLLRDWEHSDFKVFQQIFSNEEYESVMCLLKLNTSFGKPHIIIDAGSNIGLTSLYFSYHLKHIEVYAIEPDVNNFEILQENCSNPQKGTKFVVLNNSLAESQGKSFFINNPDHLQSDWAKRTEENNEGNIKGITIGEIIKQYSLPYISLLKIDIEGAEYFILQAKNDLEFLKTTFIIALEIHDEFVARNDIYQILITHGFLIFENKETTIGINKSLFTTVK